MGVCGRLLDEIAVQIPPVAWMSVSCEYCALSSKVLCDVSIARPESLPSVRHLNVIAKLQQRRGLGPLGQSSREKKKSHYGDRMH